MASCGRRCLHTKDTSDNGWLCAQFKHLVFFAKVFERRLNRSSILCPFCLSPKSNPFRCSLKISAWYKSELIVVGGRADPNKSVQQGLHCLDHGRTDVCTVLANSTSPTIVRAQQQDKYKYKTLLDNFLQQIISCCQSPESLTLPLRNSFSH